MLEAKADNYPCSDTPKKECRPVCVHHEDGTETCHQECSDITCIESIASKVIFSVSGLYGLTPSERSLASKEPTKTLKAYRLSWTAELECNNLYLQSRTNDESDACRHFVWAWLLTKDLGVEFANNVLNAHEDDSREPQTERAMDLANNRQGQLAEQTSKSPNDEAEMLRSFKENILKKNLIILTPKPENKKW